MAWLDTTPPANPLALTFTNAGTAETQALSTEVHGDSAVFTIAHNTCVGHVLQPAATCQVELVLKGDAAGTYDGQLIVRSGRLSEVAVELHGKLTAAKLVLSAASTEVELDAGTSAALQFDLANVGGSTSGPIAFEVNTAGPVVSAPCVGGRLPAGEHCPVTVTYQAPVGVDHGLGATLFARADPGGEAQSPVTYTLNLTASTLGYYYLVGLVGEPVDTPISLPSKVWPEANLEDVVAGGAVCSVVANPCAAAVASGGCTVTIRCTATRAADSLKQLVLRSTDHAVYRSRPAVAGVVALLKLTSPVGVRIDVSGTTIWQDSGTCGFRTPGTYDLTITTSAQAFYGWSGDCTGTDLVCHLPVQSGKKYAVVAQFRD